MGRCALQEGVVGQIFLQEGAGLCPVELSVELLALMEEAEVAPCVFARGLEMRLL